MESEKLTPEYLDYTHEQYKNMAKQKWTPEYLDYIQFCRETQWDWTFIHTWLKQTEDHVQYYYDTYTQEEFNHKVETDENFRQRWGKKETL